MLKYKVPNVLTRTCPFCKCEYDVVIKPKELKFIPEFNELENYPLDPCPDCGSVEILNMNLPDDESDIADKIPDDEWNKRHLIKNVKKFILGQTGSISKGIPKKPVKE